MWKTAKQYESRESQSKQVGQPNKEPQLKLQGAAEFI